MKTLAEIDKKLKKARSLWLSSGIRGMNKMIPAINRLLDEKLEIKTKKSEMKA